MTIALTKKRMHAVMRRVEKTPAAKKMKKTSLMNLFRITMIDMVAVAVIGQSCFF